MPPAIQPTPKFQFEYASVGLTLPNQSIVDFIEHNISHKDISIFNKRSWPGERLLSLTVPTGFDPIKPIKLNSLVWPTNKATDWAYMHAVCDKEQLETIQKEISGDQNNKQFDSRMLVMSTGTSTIKPWMYLLQPKPLSGIRGVNGLYLITLVDQRYYWHMVPCPDFGIFDPCKEQGSSGSSDGSSAKEPVEWEVLYNIMESTLNAALTTVPYTGQTGTSRAVEFLIGKIDPRFLYPSEKLNLEYENLPMVLDAVAKHVGHTVTVGWDNKIRIDDYDKSLKILQGNYQKTNNEVRAGGFSFIGDL